jgi:hypothetical protein
VTRHTASLFTAAGCLALMLGISLHLWIHGNMSHFASGFLLGISIALLIRGLASESRGIPR